MTLSQAPVARVRKPGYDASDTCAGPRAVVRIVYQLDLGVISEFILLHNY